jgi:hypothetical protein
VNIVQNFAIIMQEYKRQFGFSIRDIEHKTKEKSDLLMQQELAIAGAAARGEYTPAAGQGDHKKK